MSGGISKLKKEVKFFDVVQYLNVPYKRIGRNYSILCCFHDDKHYGNCFFKPDDNSAYCAACERQISSLDLIQCELSCDAKRAVQELYEIAGRPDWFNSRSEKRKGLDFSNDDFRFLGIQFQQTARIPMCETRNKLFNREELPKNTYYDCDSGNGFLLYKLSDSFDWHMLMSEKEMRELVSHKIREKEHRLMATENVMTSLGRTEAYQEEWKKLNAIKLKIK